MKNKTLIAGSEQTAYPGTSRNLSTMLEKFYILYFIFWIYILQWMMIKTTTILIRTTTTTTTITIIKIRMLIIRTIIMTTMMTIIKKIIKK